ncbi:MAG: GNAT family N-acetyltransferase [Pseudomonadota bacterium]
MTRPILDTERLVLEPVSESHLDGYLAYYAIPNDQKGGYRAPRDPADVQAILQRAIDEWQRLGFGMFAIKRKDNGIFVGGTGIVHADDWPRHELTWWLMPDAQGTGFATEASIAVLRWAYDTLGWPVVETHMRDENRPARRLADRLGGTVIARETFPDGVTRDVFALPRPEATAA